MKCWDCGVRLNAWARVFEIGGLAREAIEPFFMMRRIIYIQARGL